MNLHEIYLSKARRDARYQELLGQGIKTRRSSLRGQQLHPEYIQDAKLEGITYETGFGNTDYQRIWPVIYIIEDANKGGN